MFIGERKWRKEMDYIGATGRELYELKK